MKRLSIGIGVFGILFLMISITTAVPAAQSKPLMSNLERIEELENSLSTNELTVSQVFSSQGIIDLLIQLITVIINLVLEIISIVQSVMTLIAIIQSLFNAVQLLIDLFGQLMELIGQLFNPEPLMG